MDDSPDSPGTRRRFNLRGQTIVAPASEALRDLDRRWSALSGLRPGEALRATRQLGETVAEYVMRMCPDHELVLRDELERLQARDREFTQALQTGWIHQEQTFGSFLNGLWKCFRDWYGAKRHWDDGTSPRRGSESLGEYVARVAPDLELIDKERYRELTQIYTTWRRELQERDNTEF